MSNPNWRTSFADVGAAAAAVFLQRSPHFRPPEDPLADGLTDERVVVCPLHNFTYDMCSGDEVSGSGLSVRTYPVSAVDGAIRITT